MWPVWELPGNGVSHTLFLIFSVYSIEVQLYVTFLFQLCPPQFHAISSDGTNWCLGDLIQDSVKYFIFTTFCIHRISHGYQVTEIRLPFMVRQAVDADDISNLRSELGNQLASKSHNLNLRQVFFPGLSLFLYCFLYSVYSTLIRTSLYHTFSDVSCALLFQGYWGCCIQSP